MKLLITTITIIFINFEVTARSLNGVYECKMTKHSQLRAKVIVKNFIKNPKIDRDTLKIMQGEVGSYEAQIIINNKIYSGANTFFVPTDDPNEWFNFDLRHSTANFQESQQGLSVSHHIKEFSDKNGYQVKKKHFAFCKSQ